MSDKLLYVVTNRKLVKNGNIYDAVARASASGADVIILREKDLPEDDLLRMARQIKKITDFYAVPLIINGSPKVALEVRAYGYHSGWQGFRQTYINAPLQLGISVHSIGEAVSAQKLGADYLIAGNVFPTASKPGLAAKGTEFVKLVSAGVSIPVIAIGGVNQSNAAAVLEAGAGGVAVMSSAMEDNDGSYIKALKKCLLSACSSHG